LIKSLPVNPIKLEKNLRNMTLNSNLDESEVGEMIEQVSEEDQNQALSDIGLI
jgi:hypothetical protein